MVAATAVTETVLYVLFRSAALAAVVAAVALLAMATVLAQSSGGDATPGARSAAQGPSRGFYRAADHEPDRRTRVAFTDPGDEHADDPWTYFTRRRR
jgi:hypothetical protein